MSRLERGDDRQQAGVIAELLFGELLHHIAMRTEIEPGHGQGVPKPDFRIHDAEGNAITVEVTHFMDSSDERHAQGRAWECVVRQLKRIVRPLPELVIVRASGTPHAMTLDDAHVGRIQAAIRAASGYGIRETVSLSARFGIEIKSNRYPEAAGKDSLLPRNYEFPEAVVDVRGKLRRIMTIVKGKADKYSAVPCPFVVAVNCPTAFLWLREADDLEPLRQMLEDVRCSAIWLFENLWPWNLGVCQNHLIENSAAGKKESLDLLRRAQERPLHELLGLGPAWSRLVGFDSPGRSA